MAWHGSQHRDVLYSTRGIVCTQVTGCKSSAPTVALIAGLNWCFVSSSSLPLPVLPSDTLLPLKYMSVVHPHPSLSLSLSNTASVFVRLFFPLLLCIQLCPRQSHLPERRGKAEGWGPLAGQNQLC